MLWTLLLIVGTIVLDQWTKYWAVANLQPVGTMPLIENILHLTYVENRGAAFGMLADHRWVFMILSTVSILLIFIWLLKEKPQSPWIRVSLAFIIGGGIGNMIDRVRLEYVVDFIDVRAIDFYVFNVADSFVCVGCAMVMIWAVRHELTSSGKKKEDAAASDEEKAPESAEGDNA